MVIQRGYGSVSDIQTLLPILEAGFTGTVGSRDRLGLPLFCCVNRQMASILPGGYCGSIL